MGRGRKISPDMQWAIVRLSELLDHETIATCLELSTRSVRRVISHFHEHGTIPSRCEPSGQFEETSRREEPIEELQQQQECETHSEGLESHTYCHSPSSSGVCYPLTHSDLSFWAQEIMEGRATIDEKPAALSLRNAMPRGSSTMGMPITVNIGYAGFSGPGTYGCPPLVQVLLPGWGPHGYQGGSGPSYSPHLISSSHNTPPSVLLPSISEIPDIISWFSYLDRHEQRNKDGFIFSPYGPALKAKGFVLISQLSSDFVRPSDLQIWLGITLGLAILILQYAQEDMEAVKLGRFVVPKDS